MFFLIHSAANAFYTLSLHDALPIYVYMTFKLWERWQRGELTDGHGRLIPGDATWPSHRDALPDRKSTRLNSSHMSISYAAFCRKKKNTNMMAANNTNW